MPRAALPAGVAFLAVALLTAPEARSVRLADAMIPKTPAIFLEAPASDASAFTVLERVLRGTAAPFGLEGAASPGDTRPNTPRTVDRTIKLNGERLGEALDAITRVNPHFHWIESDGRILVRGVPDGQGLLTQRVPHFAVTNAGPRAALQALITALDPSRKPDQGFDGMLPAHLGPELESASRRGRNVSMKMDDAPVLSILNAVARENGSISWTVEYDDAPATYENASWSFVAVNEQVTAVSPRAMRTWSDAMHNPLADAAPGMLRIAATGEIGSMLTRYGHAARIRIDVEQTKLAIVRPTTGMLTIDVPIRDPAAAVAAIVALDDRYLWIRSGEVFRVTPKPEIPGRLTPLDRTVDSFAAASEPIGSVLQRIIWLMGGQPNGGSGAELGNGPWPGDNLQQRFQALRATPITVTLPHSASVRDVLDAICESEGTLSWQLQPRALGGFLELTLSSFNGWGLTQAFQPGTPPAGPKAAPPPARASRLPGAKIPAGLDRDVDQTAIPIGAAAGQAFLTLAALAHVPMGVEVLPGPPRERPNPDPRVVTAYKPTPSVSLGPGKLSDAVYLLLERIPGYELSTKNGLISLAPTSLLGARDHFMNVPIDRFEAKDVSIYRAVTRLRHQLNPSVEERDWPYPKGGSFPGPNPMQRLDATKALMDRRVTLSIEHATPREILDRLVAQHGELIWSVTYQAQSPYDQAKPIETDCVVQLEPFRGVGFNVIIPPMRASVPVTSTTAAAAPVSQPPVTQPAAPPAARGASVRPIRLALPATTSGLRSVLSGLGMAHRVPFGWEVIEPPDGPRSSPNPAPGGTYYDLTALSIEQALDKLVGYMPDYAWSSDAGVYHVRPRILGANANVALNLRVDRFEASLANVSEALAAIHRMLDPGFVFRGGANSTPDRLKAVMEKPMTVSLRNVTVRDVLDEMVRQNGGASWWASYTGAAGGYAGLNLGFAGFDGWGAQMPAHVR